MVHHTVSRAKGGFDLLSKLISRGACSRRQSISFHNSTPWTFVKSWLRANRRVRLVEARQRFDYRKRGRSGAHILDRRFE